MGVSALNAGIPGDAQTHHSQSDDMSLEDQVREQAVERAVENLVGKPGENSWDRTKLLQDAENLVAKRVAEKFWEKHSLDLLEKLDLDKIIKLAMLKLINKVTEGMYR